MLYFNKLFNKKRQPKDRENLETDKILEAEDKEASLLEDDNEETELDNEETEIDDQVTVTETESQEIEPDNPDGDYEVVEREILPAKIICPDCGGITLEGLEFCDKCGGEL